MPQKLARIVFGLGSSSVWVASTCIDLGRADAPAPGAHPAVGRGVAVAADERHAGQHDAECGGDDMDDAVLGVVNIEQPQPELRAVLLHRKIARAVGA